ncbi:hypothetical protein [Paenibacillus oryzae]|uniref:hypothetical protein n=1 Tax=Paenibacillus oryzae TaxID=1844972 RepID=UPI0012EAAF5F|nr:hypothetical protein [Paenibacillus oryzae]
MFKEMIRQLASGIADKEAVLFNASVQLAGISVEEQKALLDVLKGNEEQTSFFGYGWN